jgi:hypothetical protein
MKTITKILAAAFVLTLANKSFGQSTVTATSTATIVEPISIANSRDLAFGSIAKGVNGGTVVLTPASTTVRSGTGDVTLVTSTYSSAKFTVTGDAGRSFFITLPGTVSIATSAGAGDNMSVGTFTSDASTSSSTLSGTIGSGTGSLVFYVGATLTVKSTQLPGTYSGNFDVTVNYL